MDQASTFRADCARIHRDWHDCARRGDAAGLLALYAEDAVLESPLVPVVLDDATSGVLRGRAAIQRFLAAGAKRLTRTLTRWHRSDAWMTDGARLLVWEYPQEAPDGQQLDIVEVMEIADGLIRKHRIYWGWFGAGLLMRQARGELAL
jgi:ketosteroid isomerase-like protein